MGTSTRDLLIRYILLLILLFKYKEILCQDETVRGTSNTCKTDLECPDNAFCKPIDDNGYCACKDKYVIHPMNKTHRECLRVADRLGDPCKNDIQCHVSFSTSSECIQNSCQCKAGCHFEDGRCYKTSIIGERCSLNEHCYLGPGDESSKLAFCVRGYCQCTLLHSPRDGGTRCLKDAMLGDQCEDDEHCAFENGRCHDVCRCIDGYIVHTDEDRCVKVASAINEACEIDAQCTSFINGTMCIDQKCVCQWDYHMLNSRCWRTRSMGQRCNSDQECFFDAKEMGQCVEGVCTCQGCDPFRNGSSALQPKIAAIILLVLSLLIYGKRM